MTAQATQIETLASRLDDAARHAQAIAQLAEPLGLADAYRVQAASIARRIDRGERRIGIKMGFTSRAKMVQMGLNEMIWGRLTDAMLIEDGGAIAFDRYVHPRVEPEIAFLLRAPLAARVTAAAALAAVEAVAPALEIIDSRYENFKFSLTDVVADNSSSSSLVVGPWASPGTDISNLGMILSVNGVPRQIGSSAAILGHPIRSLVAAARLAAEAGEPLRAGDIVMAGGATAAEPLAPGQHVRLEAARIGRAEFFVKSRGVSASDLQDLAWLPAAPRHDQAAAPAFDLLQAPGHLLRRNHQRSYDLFTQRVGDRATRQQAALMIALSQRPGASQNELVGQTGMDKSTLKELLGRMAARGLVERLRDPDDSRAWRLLLTGAGERLLAELMPQIAAAQRDILAPLPEADRPVFIRMLRVLAGLE